jgi:hypothetical protein
MNTAYAQCNAAMPVNLGMTAPGDQPRRANGSPDHSSDTGAHAAESGDKHRDAPEAPAR